MTNQSHYEHFIDNPTLNGREDRFITITAKMDMIIASWRESIFSHEWLHQDGSIKSTKELSERIQEKRIILEKQIAINEKLPRPVLGIGITDSIEIGSGRDIVLTLAAQGHKTIEVHIPKSHQTDFRIFTA